MMSSGTMSTNTRQSGHFQHFQMTKNAIAESITIVAVTEMP